MKVMHLREMNLSKDCSLYNRSKDKKIFNNLSHRNLICRV